MSLSRTPPFTFGRLLPIRHPGSASNTAMLGPMTLGIEVTEAELADRCGLGNIDPQHGLLPAGRPLAAIEAATTWPLPPLGAHLVTLRPDSDAIGAMAVLLMRHEGVRIEADMLTRIRLIGQWDNFDLGDWPTWRQRHPALPRPATRRDLGGPPLAIRALAALAHSPVRTLDDKVERMAAWLERGVLDPWAVSAARAFDEGLLHAWNVGQITLAIEAEGRIAVVAGDHPGALRLGYRVAPVVIAEGAPGGLRRFSFAQFEPGWIDLTKLWALLNSQESGWGGSITILGSPQGVETQLSLADVLAAARECLPAEFGRRAA